ncbi:tripartite tricarboxylate transporter substrate binding protein [Neoroseomonas rubea]|uniref:tripartite tricarboxylate transporter substrate binding protein n=1 Tax=Neoroseomonas rubea TaxID=2748666 RepID=UPI0018E01417|nr:tripartite tricarboxylate transporter substrate binding protein [Roseomonas rubea]
MQRRALMAALAASAFGCPGLAQGLPAEIRMIVPFAAGGATDLLARRLQPVLEPRGHRLVVENLVGGGSMVGMNRLAQSRPDGRTVGMGSSGLIGQIVANEIPLRFEQFTPLVRVAVDPLVIVTGSGSRFVRFEQVLEAMRAGPGPSMGAAGPRGTIGHLRLAGIADQIGGQFTYVGYPGASRVATELVGGHLDLAIVKPNDVFGQIRGGALRVLAVVEEERVRQLPQAPTVVELGLRAHPFGRLTQMTFVNAPAGLPPDLRDALIVLLREAVLSPDYQAKSHDDGYIADALAGAALEAAIAETGDAIRTAQQKVTA